MALLILATRTKLLELMFWLGEFFVNSSFQLLTFRYHRVAGKDVFFLTGTDEHGQKVAESAAKGT